MGARDEESGKAQDRKDRRKGGAEGEKERRSSAGGLGFVPPRRGVTPPARNELVEAEPAPTRESGDSQEAQDAERLPPEEGGDRLMAALSGQRRELEASARKRVEAARDEGRKQGEARLRAREEELAREIAEAEAELARTRERLALAEDRLASLEQVDWAEGAEWAEREMDDSHERTLAVPGAAQGGEARVSLSAASFEELRALGMSMTQARRVLRYREEQGMSSLDDLDQIPGLPRAFRAELKQAMVP